MRDSSVDRDSALQAVVSRLTLASGTYFRGKSFPFPLIQEEQVVSYWRKNGHLILVNCFQEAYPTDLSCLPWTESIRSNKFSKITSCVLAVALLKNNMSKGRKALC